MPRLLIAYATSEGQTAKIAKFIAEELKTLGLETDLFSVEQLPKSHDPSRYDGVLLGSPIHASHFSAPLVEWVKNNARALSSKPSAFFSVCLGILQKDEGVQQHEKRIVENFLSDSGWQPTRWTILAGALPYTKYGWLKRMIMKRITKAAGGDTDTSRDYEYTNWQDVKAFARELADEIRRPPALRSGPPREPGHKAAGTA